LQRAISLGFLSALVLATWAACVPRDAPRREGEGHTTGFDFRLIGPLSFDRSKGVLVLQLGPFNCIRSRAIYDADHNLYFTRTPCPGFPNYGWQAARLVPPSGKAIPPSTGSESGVTFHIDWSKLGVDPLAAGTPARLAQPWLIMTPDASEPRQWLPQREDVDAMVALIGEATDTQVDVADVSAPPKIEVVEFGVEGELRNGMAGELVLTARNVGGGGGDAYRLTATTRSNIKALHGLQFSFGHLAPGTSKTRRVHVDLPRGNDEERAVVVLIFSEAHRFTPDAFTGRFTVGRAVDLARLAMTCKLEGDSSQHPMVDAGTTVRVSCDVRNDGGATKGVRVRAALGRSPAKVTSAPFDLGIGRAHTVSLAIELPKDAAIDSELVVSFEAFGGKDCVPTSAQLTLAVARPRICPNGPLTREDYAKRIAELQRKLDAGLITTAEFDKYEAELTACLED